MRATLGSALRQVSVEPALLLYHLAASTAGMAATNLYLQKACSPDHPLPLGEQCGFDEESQRVITSINSWKPICEFTLPVGFILFGGVWSDSHGKRRKPLMVLPILGEMLSLFFTIASVFFWSWSAEATALSEALARGISGGRACFSFGAITYIGDVTLQAQRTFRIAIVTSLIFFSTPLGYALGTILREFQGFYVTFILCMALNIVALGSVCCLLKQSSEIHTTREKSCGIQEIFDAWRILFKPRVGSKRTILMLMVIVSPLFGGCLMGEYSVLYLYVRHKFHWGESESGVYLAFRMSVVFFGTLLSIGVLSKVLHLSDAVIGLLAATFQIAAGLGNAFARHSWQMFLYPCLDLIHGSIFTVGHSIVSKTVEHSELGRVNSVLSTIDSLIPLVVLPLYNTVYGLMLNDFPGAFFLISVIIASVCWLIFLTTVFLKRGDRTKVHMVIA